MGLVSYQEDNLDAKGEPVKVGKKEVPAMVIEELDDLEELDSGTEVKNTVIIKADGLAINSVEIDSYSFDIAFMDNDVGKLEPQIDLTAAVKTHEGPLKTFNISTFYDIEEACSLLVALMLAIENQEAVFNVSTTHIKGDEL